MCKLSSLCVFGVIVLCAGCDSKKSAQPPSATTATTASLAEGKTEPKEENGAEDNAPTGECPNGRWKYDYADRALDVMLSNLPGSKVLKKEGDFICDIAGGQTGMMTCATQDKPVVNVVSVKQAGMAMTVSVNVDGKAVTKFERISGKTLKLTSSDLSGLKVDASMKVAGREMPFPAEKLMTLFGKENTQVSFKCEGSTLSIKPEVEGVKTDWQTLERL